MTRFEESLLLLRDSQAWPKGGKYETQKCREHSYSVLEFGDAIELLYLLVELRIEPHDLARTTARPRGAGAARESLSWCSC